MSTTTRFEINSTLTKPILRRRLFQEMASAEKASHCRYISLLQRENLNDPDASLAYVRADELTEAFPHDPRTGYALELHELMGTKHALGSLTAQHVVVVVMWGEIVDVLAVHSPAETTKH